MIRQAEHYNKDYFDKWYRHPGTRVSTPEQTARKAALSLAMAEYYLERKVRTVLDIGCGEGQWNPILKRLRPAIRYTGVDSSEYALAKYGRSRNLRFGSFGELASLKLAPSYDLIICSDLLYYLNRRDVLRGLGVIAAHLGGVAFLEAYGTKEIVEGDTKHVEARTPAFYQKTFREYGLIPCGSHCYVGPALAGRVTQLEQGGVTP